MIYFCDLFLAQIFLGTNINFDMLLWHSRLLILFGLIQHIVCQIKIFAQYQFALLILNVRVLCYTCLISFDDLSDRLSKGLNNERDLSAKLHK